MKQLLMKSGLPMPVLGHIWYVFCCAMHCVTCGVCRKFCVLIECFIHKNLVLLLCENFASIVSLF